jgi:hypothetical protein
MRLVSALRSGSWSLSLALSIALSAATSTHVERGETVTTGVAAYDTFFREVAEVKGEADKAGSDLNDAARPLNDAIGPQNKAAPAEAVRAEAKKLQLSGTLLHLDLLPEAKLVTSGKPEASSEKLLAAAEQSAKGSIAVARRADELLIRIADLERRLTDLTATAKSSFPDEGKRNDIARELKGAGAVLAAARKTGEQHGGAASKLVLDLAMALETGAGPGAVASGKKPTGKPGAGPKPGGTSTGTASTPKPKGGDDFDK